MNEFKMQISSPTNREKLVVEILYKDSIIAEINQEKESLEIEVYSSSNNILQLPLEQFQEILEKAKLHLLEK
jgi:hypothetical protein